jgi:hypothetical protein
MSQHDITGVLVEDARIADLTGKNLHFPIYSGAQTSTFQPFPFNSQSNSSLVCNIQLPSESIVSDAKVLFQSDLNLTINLANVPVGKQCFAYGLTDSLNSYPLQSLFTTASLTLNNATSSTNYNDILPFIKLLEDKNRLDKSDSFTPDFVNQHWGRYSDAVLSNSNPMGNYNESTLNNDRIPNGSFPYSYYSVNHYVNGQFEDNSTISTSLNDTWVIYISFSKITEPFLCLSPFINNGEYSKAGLLGINNLALTLNINTACSKVWATGNSFVNQAGNGLSSYITSISLGNPQSNNFGFTNSKLLLNMLSLSEIQFSRISQRSITSFVDYPRYLSPASNSPILAPGQTGNVQFQNIQISQVPALLVFALRVPLSQQNWAYTDSFLKINTISITFNNQSGLLASGNTAQIYSMSVDSGSTQSFYSFNGSANAIQQNGESTIIPTLGSMCVINCSKWLSLNELLTASSLGQFNLQINVNCTNNHAFTIQPEGVILTTNIGIAVCEMGTSSYFTGVIDRQTVLETKTTEDESKIVDEQFYENAVGGKMHRGPMSIHKLVKHTKGMKKHHSEEGGRKHMSKSKLHKLLK